MNVAPSTKAAYASHIRVAFRRLGEAQEAEHRALTDLQEIAERFRPFAKTRKASPIPPQLITEFDHPGMDATDARIVMLYAAAARFADLAHVRMEDVQCFGQTVQLRLIATKTTKTSVGRSILCCPLPNTLGWLKRRLETATPSAYLFDSSYAQTSRRLKSRIGEQYTLHSLRRGAVQAAMRAGIADRDVMRLTGHQSRRALAEYAEALPLTWRLQCLRAARAIRTAVEHSFEESVSD